MEIKPKQSIFGWNRDDTFEVVRSESVVKRKQWFVSLREQNTGEWWHGEANLSEEQAKAVFDLLASFPASLLQQVLPELIRISASI